MTPSVDQPVEDLADWTRDVKEPAQPTTLAGKRCRMVTASVRQN